MLALVCLILVAVSGAVQVAHTHADGAVTHSDCSLCAAAHISVHLAQTPASAHTVVLVRQLDVVVPCVVPVALSTFALFTRPPPVDIVPA